MPQSTTRGVSLCLQSSGMQHFDPTGRKSDNKIEIETETAILIFLKIVTTLSSSNLNNNSAIALAY